MIQEPPSRAWIGCLSAAAVIIAAIIGLGAPFAENLAARYIPPLTPTPDLIVTNAPVASIQTVNPVPTVSTEPTTAVVPQVQSKDYCFGNCWQYDEDTRTMTWTGSTDGSEDIWQPEGEALEKVRNGYVTLITTSVPGEILACVLSIDGKSIKNACDGIFYELPPGTYRIASASKNAGGFRWCPQVGHGWRVNGGDCQ